MIHTTEEIQAAFERHIQGDPYYHYREIPPVKIWYDGEDHSFHTSVGVSLDFEKFELDGVNAFDEPELGIGLCLDALYYKIMDVFRERGVDLHSLYPD